MSSLRQQRKEKTYPYHLIPVSVLHLLSICLGIQRFVWQPLSRMEVCECEHCK